MKYKRGRGFCEVREVEEPVPHDDEVLIRIKAAGICGSDLHFYDGSLTTCIPPVILGHEFSGVIEQVGKNVIHFKEGDRVVAEAHKGGCGLCVHCLTGKVEICDNKKAAGYKIDGCFAPYLTLPEFALHRIPENLTFEQAALIEPLAIGVKGVLERTRVDPEDFVVVLGCGPIGLLAAAAARAEGARKVLITGTARDEKIRLPAAAKMKIDYAVNSDKEDLFEKVMDLTNGRGADLVVEACGAEPAIHQAFEIIRKEGRISAVGHTGKKTLSVPWETGLMKSVQLTWSHSSNWTSWERAISILAGGKIDVSPLISYSFPLAEWEKAFELLENMEAIKILLLP
ncbi:MAG: alcohol dehydrogenase catalytic domain-containing protein [Desulfobacterales bacterium]|nr:MAG: alcohol dehydrogenase catalytic domain-containing protein [Desulfobacterales bacterium]